MTDPDQLAKAWTAAWNSHDLDRILDLYADDCEMSSPKIAAFGKAAGGSLRGKANLREYWATALRRQPNLHFELGRVFASPDSVVLAYTDHRGHVVCEFLRYGDDGRIIQGAAHHAVAAASTTGTERPARERADSL